MTPATEKQSWDEFLEFEEIVQRHAVKLGLEPGTTRYNEFGRAMSEAVQHGRFEGLESMVKL